ncbi:30S ribosomal protein S12 methylthiotransferase RimO [bacterium]|nr:30S ribosomal protein S12 methylthiotransferase RimO [bacterium]
MNPVRLNPAPLVGFISLGCPKNQVDCELMISRAVDTGFQITTDIARANALVVNTCAFIEQAQSEADEAIREALEYKERGTCRAVIVAGCLPQYLKERCSEAYPEVDAWLTPNNPHRLGEVLAGLLVDEPPLVADPHFPLPEYLATAADGRVLSTPPSLAYLKIAEGCDHHCRFCLIPGLRGRYRSREQDDLLAEAVALAEMGVNEIALVSQDSSYYGRDLGNTSLAELLTGLADQDGDFWIRVMYLYPDHLTPELLETWAGLAQRTDGPRLLPYFDIPVQHVSAPVLKAMGRRGDRRSIDALFRRVRAACPEAVIRSSLIVGYPGETEDQFNELFDWVQSGKVDRLGVFTYSDLPEMNSHQLPDHVPPELAAQRQDLLLEAQYDVALELNTALTGSEVEVLLEEEAEGGGSESVYIGRSWREAFEIDGLVEVRSASPLELFTRVRARVVSAEAYDLYTEVR